MRTLMLLLLPLTASATPVKIGVIDFEKAVQDPAHPGRYLPQYDAGDHLHPNDAGHQAMARAVDLALFGR